MTTESQPHVWADSELVMISALEHWAYCPRQCALIHVERTFDENIYTLRGRMEHTRVHEESTEQQGEFRIERGLPLWSRNLGLVGKSDVVEFHGSTPYPVEYKHGKRQRHVSTDVQLCAQALCLEEMMRQQVPKGAIYHQASRHRREVIFNESLRHQVLEAIIAVRTMLTSELTPTAVNDARCDECSLKDSCMPSVTSCASRLYAVHARLFQVKE